LLDVFACRRVLYDKKQILPGFAFKELLKSIHDRHVFFQVKSGETVVLSPVRILRKKFLLNLLLCSRAFVEPRVLQNNGFSTSSRRVCSLIELHNSKYTRRAAEGPALGDGVSG
jgi:hypothetical protein